MGRDPNAIAAALTLYVFIGLPVGTLVQAILLRAAAKWAERMEIRFGDACRTMFFSILVSLFVGFITGVVYGVSGAVKYYGQLPMQIVLLPLLILIQARIISIAHTLTFRKGLKIALFMLLIQASLIAVVGGGVWLLFKLIYAR